MENHIGHEHHDHSLHHHHHGNFIIRNNLATPIAILVAGAMIAAAICWGGRGSTASGADIVAQAPDQAPSAQAVDASKVKTAGVPFIGQANAKVTFAFWSDYQCPFCKRFQGDAIEQTIKDYVASGKVKILFKDFAFLGADSQTAAIAGRAVWEVDPAKFYAWHTAMFAKQDTENGGWGSKDDIIALTSTVLGANEANQVSALMASKAATYTAAIAADKAEGGSFGVNGTPGSVIGKTFVNGAQPYASVKAAIEKALSGK